MPTRVLIRPPRSGDQHAFLDAVKRRRILHRGWVSPPSTRRSLQASWAHPAERHRTFLVWLKQSDDLTGVINLNEIVRGGFRSAYLGYYGFEPCAGRGFMREGLALAINFAFTKLRLHRLEANI